MKPLFKDYPCTNHEVARLRDDLVPLYEKLSKIVQKDREFGGFVESGELPQRFHMSANTYPPLRIRFSKGELATLASYSGLSSEALVAQASTPLERLLIATIWKNGDVQKVRHIVDGLGLGSNVTLDEKTKGPVFKQFGRHLADPDRQPIADQHTLRAYRMLTSNDPSDKAHLKDTSSGYEIQQYVDWVQKLAGADLSRDRLHAFDKSMFALGSATKYVLSPPRRDRAGLSTRPGAVQSGK